MNHKKIEKKVIIKEEDEYEGKPCIDYLITSIIETKKKIEKIHSIISEECAKDSKNKILTKEEEKEINKEFIKIFNINSNKEEKIFDYLNELNQNHIKKYKKIFKFLNLNLIARNNNKILTEEKEENNKKEKNEIKNLQIIEKKENKNLEKEDMINKKVEVDNIVNNSTEKNISKNKNEINDNENDKELDNDIIINENDDSIININLNEYLNNYQRKKNNEILLNNVSNSKSKSEEQFNDNFDNNFSNNKKENLELNTNRNMKFDNSNNLIYKSYKNNSQYYKKLTKNQINAISIQHQNKKIKENEDEIFKKGGTSNNVTNINLSSRGFDDKNENFSCDIF